MKMTKTKHLLSLLVALPLAATLTAGSQEVSYAIEDAAYQAATLMGAHLTKDITRVAFVKLWLPEGEKSLPNSEIEATVFESALGAVPAPFTLVLHSNRDAQWKLIDDVFDQASDFESYSPATHPELNKLELCDALLLAKAVSCSDDDQQKVTSIRIALKLIEVKTSRQVWSAVVDGQYDKTASPDNESLPYFVRKALEYSAANAVARIPKSLDGYGVLLLPLEGRYGHAMTQIFLNALTAAGRQDSIRIFNLPNGNAADRMVGRFLWERTGSERALEPMLLKRIENSVGAKGKLAVMSGMITTGRVYPKTWRDPTGLALDRLTGTHTEASDDPTSIEIVADLKFRDLRDSFRVLAAISADGVWERDLASDTWQQLRSFVTVRNIILMLPVLLFVLMICRFLFRVR